MVIATPPPPPPFCSFVCFVVAFSFPLVFFGWLGFYFFLFVFNEQLSSRLLVLGLQDILGAKVICTFVVEQIILMVFWHDTRRMEKSQSECHGSNIYCDADR